MMGYLDDKITPGVRNLNLPFRPWTPDNELTLTRVPNTQITCRLCRGSKFVAPRSKIDGIQLAPCPNCNATGIQISDHKDSLWGRNR